MSESKSSYKISKGGDLESFQQESKSIPGPGSYSPVSNQLSCKKRSTTAILRPRESPRPRSTIDLRNCSVSHRYLVDPMMKPQSSVNLGPGHYLEDIFSKSSWDKVPAVPFGMKRFEPMLSVQSRSPGPGHYDKINPKTFQSSINLAPCSIAPKQRTKLTEISIIKHDDKLMSGTWKKKQNITTSPSEYSFPKKSNGNLKLKAEKSTIESAQQIFLGRQSPGTHMQFYYEKEKT